MNFKKVLSIILCVVLTLAMASVVSAAKPVVKLSISVGQGATKDISTYLKSGTKSVTWTNTNPAVATISGKTLKGIKVGSTVVKGSDANATYQITVKVLANASDLTTLDNKTDKKVKNSEGNSITYEDRYITMGVNDTLDISKLCDSKSLNYSDFRWTVSNDKYVDFKKGKITAKKEGLVRVTAIPQSGVSKKSTKATKFYRFFVTVDSSYMAKNITVSKEKLTPIAPYLGDSPENYVFSVKSATGSSVKMSKDKQYLTSSKSAGSSIVTAVSTNGKSNYCFVVKIR